MCGICGIVDRRGRLEPIAVMNGVQQHRGPDDGGFLLADSSTGAWRLAAGPDTMPELNLPPIGAVGTAGADLVLGSRRLAILDLSAAGHMPMSYQDGALWLVFNGEIYNYIELRQELAAAGHTFASGSDTEVIMAAYAEWGVDCLSHFNGMFAFALWDGRRRRLFCGRDRFGIKPFYYHNQDGFFVFASEIKTLLHHPAVPREPNDRAIFDYLSLGQSDHTEQTFFQGIFALPAAHFLLLDLATGQIDIRRWWEAVINPAVHDGTGRDKPERYEQYAHLLEDGIRLRLRSDVPVGSCLSGGLDSSSVVTLANRLLLEEQVIPASLVGDHQKTFTARNREADIDEYQYSHLIVERTGAEENLVFPDPDLLWREIESFVWHLDEPVDSTSQYPQWNVMRLARQRGVTVLLDGQGGDETLAGYYAYYPPYLSQIRQELGLPAAIQAGWIASRVGGSPVRGVILDHLTNQLPWRLQQGVRRLLPPQGIPGGGGSGLKEWQLAPEFLKRFADRRWQPFTGVDESGLAGLLYRDLTTTNLPKLLRYEDRNSMAFSLEARLPFLDYRLVEMVFQLPLNYRLRDGWSKWILRRSMDGLLPPEICWRRSKLGFPTPELGWLKAGVGQIRDLLTRHDGGPIHCYLGRDVLRQIRDQGDDDLVATPGLWRIFNLILWHDIYFNRSPQAAFQALSQRQAVEIFA